MGIVVTAIEPEMASRVWPDVAGMIDVGYAVGDDFVPENILEEIRYGRVVLWVAVDDGTAVVHAAMTTELVPMRSGMVCWMRQCAGNRMRDWADFHVQIEEYARKEGCVKTVLRGREGWERVLPGYKVRSVQLEKVL